MIPEAGQKRQLTAGSFRRPELALPSSRTKDNYLVSARDIVTMIPEAGQKRQLTAGPQTTSNEPVERPRAVQAAIEAARRKMSLQAEEERRKQERLRQNLDGRFQRLTGIDPATIGPQR